MFQIKVLIGFLYSFNKMEITNSIFFQYMRYHVLWHDISSLKLAIEGVSTSSVSQFSRVWLFVTPWTATLQASLSITNSQSLLKLMCIKSVMPSSHLILCHPLLLLPPIPPSISLLQWVNTSHEIAKVLKFQPQHQSFQWTPRTNLL